MFPHYTSHQAVTTCHVLGLLYKWTMGSTELKLRSRVVGRFQRVSLELARDYLESVVGA